MSLPEFKYHADPLRTGAFEPSEDVCSCCQQRRGFAYMHEVIDEDRLPDDFREICPWCVATGLAANLFGIRFVDPRALVQADLPKRIVDEFCSTTPGYSSWQSPKWLCHCNDVCVFHGDLSIEEAHNPDWQAMAEFGKTTLAKAKAWWSKIAPTYVVADPSIFKFVCRHCNKVFYQIDSP